MKRLILSALFVILFSVCTAYAHPPSDIKITFDPSTKMLKAVIAHNTSNPDKHYINKVDVRLNGNEIIEHKITKQDNNETQTIQYLIPDVKAGDTVSVEGYCSISGKLEKDVKI